MEPLFSSKETDDSPLAAPVQHLQKPGESETGQKIVIEHHLTTPGSAVQVFKAEGDAGDKVALACFSVSNFGVFASSEQAVGLFATGAVDWRMKRQTADC